MQNEKNNKGLSAVSLISVIFIIGFVMVAVGLFLLLNNHLKNPDIYTIELQEMSQGIYAYQETVVSSIPAHNYSMATFRGTDGTVYTVKGYVRICNQKDVKPYAVWEYTHVVNEDTVTIYAPVESVQYMGTSSVGRR